MILPVALAASAAESYSLYDHLLSVAGRQLAERRQAVAQIRTPEQVLRRAGETRTRLLRMIGGLPAERTPLNLRRIGSIDRGEYRVERIVFESQPRFFVTANLYVPRKGTPPYPAVIQPTGHSLTAKARELYQSLSIGLAQYGFVVLTYDPLGQGERRIFYDSDLGDSKVGSTTVEHQMVGVQALLSGQSVARPMIWDGIRGIDLLASLPEVDPQRIGVAGCSGGGTLTAYLAVLDPRLKVAAPACYVTSWEDQLPGTGPQDAEQQFPDQLLEGLDHADLVTAFAPKPYLVCSTTEDFFPLAGAEKTVREARHIYSLMGAAEKIDWFTGPGPHGMSADTRGAIYAWMKRWLKGDPPGPAPEPDHRVELEEDLQVTPTGQVSTSLGGDTASTLNIRNAEARPAPSPEPARIPGLVRSLTRYQSPKGPLNLRRLEGADRAGCRVERLSYEAEDGRRVPATLYTPSDNRRRTVLYLNQAGRNSPDAEQLARAGYTVLAIDAAGTGETAAARSTYSSPWFSQDRPTWLALMIGRTITGLRVTDILRGLDTLRELGHLKNDQAIGVAKGNVSVALLHSAALDKRLNEIYLEGMPLSYRMIATAPVHRQMFDVIVPDVLKAYDLPELASAVAPRRIHLLNTVSALGMVLPEREVRKVFPGADVIRLRETESVVSVVAR